MPFDTELEISDPEKPNISFITLYGTPSPSICQNDVANDIPTTKMLSSLLAPALLDSAPASMAEKDYYGYEIIKTLEEGSDLP